MWDGEQWLPESDGGTFQTTATFPTVRQLPKLQEALNIATPYETVNEITYQSDVNEAIETVTLLGAKNVARTADLFDFSQNTVVQGYWTHVIDEGGAPGLGEFYAYDENGANTVEFVDVKVFKINDTGVPGRS